MTKNLDNEGLRSIADNYDLFYIDLWGVIHNGIKLHENAIITLNELIKMNKNFVLLTNAPRPNETVKVFLKKMGMNEQITDHVFTSGQASLNYLKKFLHSEKFFHIGPPRDFDLFNDFKKNQSEDLENSQYLLCTGLFDNYDTDLNYYKKLFEKYTNKKMICTNPDLIVDRGNVRELCAGSVAMVFEKMGGEVIYFGKPYPEVYNQSINNTDKKILSIGDNLNTDIKGANLLNYDSLLISNGVHRNEIKDNGIEKVSKQYESIVNFMQSDLKW
jgi:HAD superfamily hydrolase (TIGR01459 family)